MQGWRLVLPPSFAIPPLLPDATHPSTKHLKNATCREGASRSDRISKPATARMDPSLITETHVDVQPPSSMARSVAPSDRITANLIRAKQIQVVAFSDLSPEMLQKWEALRWPSDGTGELFDLPFFSPRFASAVDRARGDVLVAVASDTEQITGHGLVPEHAIGFLPFHRVGRVGVPVGRFLNDAQNIVGLSPDRIDWSEWLTACEVVAFDMHAIVQADPSWIEDYQLATVRAFRADFDGNSKKFLNRLEREHRTISKQGQKSRKLSREVGEVRLEIDCQCPEILKKTIAWKRAQYHRTHILDLFLPEWTRQLVDELHGWNTRTDHDRMSDVDKLQNDRTTGSVSFADQRLKGILSVLWAGDEVVAAHYGMIEQGRLHYWFPTYDSKYARYSPGTALFTELVRASTEYGIDCIDMGYGEQPYKQKQTKMTSDVAFGTITDSKWHRFSFSLEHKIVACLKQMPMKQLVKKGWRKVHPTAGIKKLG